MNFLNLAGNIHIPKSRLSAVQKKNALSLVSEQLQRSYPTSLDQTEDTVVATNRMFKIKFNRLNNILKGISYLKLHLVKGNSGFFIEYNANLSRCLYIASIYAVIILILTSTGSFSLKSIGISLFMWIMAFAATYASTRIILPKYLKKLISDAFNAV